jgi:hypothetical protein
MQGFALQAAVLTVWGGATKNRVSADAKNFKGDVVRTTALPS